MKRLFLKLFLLVVIVCLPSVMCVLIISPQYTHEYNASFIDKMNRLKRINEPKIVLCSNSNLAFGIQSDLIEENIGMPVVNLGLHGGLGNAFNERMALFNLNEGDIVVISHLEYYDDDKISDPELALITVENYFRYWKIFRLKDYPRIFSSIPKYSLKCIYRYLFKRDCEKKQPTCYSRSAFNEYGDNVFPRNIEAGESAPYIRHPRVNNTCMNRINKFYKYCKSRGIHLVISGAPILCGLEGFDKNEYIQFQNKVEELSECPVISDFTDYIFDKKYFYGGALHMTNEGAKLRTEQLISDLRNYLPTK